MQYIAVDNTDLPTRATVYRAQCDIDAAVPVFTIVLHPRFAPGHARFVCLLAGKFLRIIVDSKHTARLVQSIFGLASRRR